ncbi:hypothetical protein [Pseudonocardia sp. NPDC049154]|uniref:hypothetical protein n=1 Tax=Pseudonocardia sp. NPDC049154 TaxID=3155501 RepID=UPI0034066A8E
MLRKFRAQVAEQCHAKTRAPLRTTIESWHETHELEESTRKNDVGDAERHICPVLGDEPIERSPRTSKGVHGVGRRGRRRRDREGVLPSPPHVQGRSSWTSNTTGQPGGQQ